MVNWEFLTSNKTISQAITGFASGSVSGKELTAVAKNTEFAGEIRSLIRGKGGVSHARTLAKKALKRREMI